MVTIRFLTPSLGDRRGESRDTLLRDAGGRVLYLQSWWKAGLTFAAQALNRQQKTVRLLQIDPVVAGQTGIYRRYWSASEFKDHEAFLANSTLSARFFLPSGMSPDDLKALLETAGRYVGLSPFGYRQDYGRYTVESVERLGGRHGCAEGNYQTRRPSDPGDTGSSAAAGSASDVQETKADGRE
jgi:hypothetical protein